ncbi:MAG: pantetheine-phosphate adenylyltransferase [Vampirovibrionales bacterium]|nr:pantetheine-phosphate adenylyltransferase [Vampirovibrionales bacterium]
MVTAVYPGSFDPMTRGHLDIVTRASHLFDQLVVAVVRNPNKAPLLTLQQRVQLIQTCIQQSERPITNVTVQPFEGLTIDFAAAAGAEVIVRGLRAVSDFEFEFKMSQMNKTLNPCVETLFMMASLEHQFLSSSVVKEVARYGGDISKAVPPAVETLLKEHYQGGLCTLPVASVP